MTNFQQKNIGYINNYTEGNTQTLVGDPIYFVRDASRFAKTTHERAASIKLKLEHLYKVAVEQTVERNQRRIKFETKLAQDRGSEERKKRQLHSLGQKESQFLRLRRTRLSLSDFHTIKVIGYTYKRFDMMTQKGVL
ncbi:hypothetical protein PCK1_000278 [Pneumocystis canis]|nr:hypothetical protein PCK1_000278 [Pneumocystis canis]